MIPSLMGVVALLLTQDTLALTLEQAAARAVTVSPRVHAAEGAVRAPQGLRAESRWPFPENPSLSLGRTRRQSLPGVTQDRAWELTQEIDLAGQWIWRSRSATALVQSATARVDDARRLVALEARRAYLDVAIAERRAALTDSAAGFAELLADHARRQLEAGEINRLERNTATLEAARSRSAAERASAEATAAKAELARVLGLPPDTIPRTLALPRIPALSWRSDEVLVNLARARRPDVRASELARVSTERAVTAAKLARVPNVVVSAFGGREAGTDRLQGVQVGVVIPLFRRQQASIGLAEAERAAATAELTAAGRAVAADVLAASTRFRRAATSERRFATEVLRAATENVSLTERALTEGEVSVTDVLVLRGTAVAAQLEYLEVLHDAASAWFDLSAALAAEPGALTVLLNRGS
jgi:cobalt-zinc-cadmium efflux system outer membrane protein